MVAPIYRGIEPLLATRPGLGLNSGPQAGNLATAPLGLVWSIDGAHQTWIGMDASKNETVQYGIISVPMKRYGILMVLLMVI